MKKDFKDIWSRTTPRLEAGIAGWHVAMAGILGGTGAFLVTSGLMPLTVLALTAVAAAAAQGAIHVLVRREVASDAYRQGMRSAPRFVREVAADLMLKAGLSPRYKLQIGIMDAPRFSEINYNATVFPVPVGAKNDTIVIGIGANLPLKLNNEELTAVIAHELGHIVNRGPMLNPLYGAIQKAGPCLLIAATLTFNPSALFLTMGAVLAAHVCKNRALQLDEERADRTAYNLYPHDGALISAVEKLKTGMKALQFLTQPGQSLSDRFLEAATPLLSSHPSDARRQSYVQNYVRDSLKLHEKHNIPKEPGAYASLFNKAAKVQEQNGSYTPPGPRPRFLDPRAP